MLLYAQSALWVTSWLRSSHYRGDICLVLKWQAAAHLLCAPGCTGVVSGSMLPRTWTHQTNGTWMLLGLSVVSKPGISLAVSTPHISLLHSEREAVPSPPSLCHGLCFLSLSSQLVLGRLGIICLARVDQINSVQHYCRHNTAQLHRMPLERQHLTIMRCLVQFMSWKELRCCLTKESNHLESLAWQLFISKSLSIRS